MAREAKMPMLWITGHVVVEGRHWLAQKYSGKFLVSLLQGLILISSV
jgi:hypothetical protein